MDAWFSHGVSLSHTPPCVSASFMRLFAFSALLDTPIQCKALQSIVQISSRIRRATLTRFIFFSFLRGLFPFFRWGSCVVL